MTNDTNESARTKRVRRDRREEILQAATRLFSTYGYRGTSLSSVAEAVGLSEPGLLHYFPSKVELLQGVLMYREEQDLKKYSEVLDPDSAHLNEMMGILGDLVSQNEKIPSLIRLFTVLVGESIRDDHPSHDYFLNRYRYARGQYVEAFARLSENEQIQEKVDLDQLASIILAVMDGLQIQWLLDPENVSMAESFSLFSKIVAEYLEG